MEITRSGGSVLSGNQQQLYLHDNQTTRQIGQRWLDYLKRRKEANLKEAMPHLEAAGKDALMAGRSPNLREMTERLPPKVMSRVHGLYGVLREVTGRLRTISDSNGFADVT